LTQQGKTQAGRWLMWSMLALAYTIVYIHRVAPSVVADQLMEEFAVRDGAVLGSLAAMYFYVYVIMQLPSGIFADLLGPRATVSAGVLVAGFGSLFFAVAPSVFLAFVGRFLVGLGVSVIFVCILKFHAVWFQPSEFAFITGLLILVGNVGAMMAATPLALLVGHFGWRFSFLLIALISVLIAIACWVIVRDAPTYAQRPAQSPPLGERFGENLSQLWLVLKNFRSWPPFLVAFGLYGTLITFQGMWGVPYLMQVYDLSRTAAANFMLLIAAGMAVGSPLVGFISDRLQIRKLPYMICVLSYTAVWSIMVFWLDGRPPLPALYLLCFLMGFFSGTMTITFTLAKEINPPRYSGSAIAVINSGGFLSIAILQPLLGYLLDLRWDGVMREGVKIFPQAAYAAAFRFCLAILALAIIGAFLARETRGKNIYQE
jgi:MFS family permease